jgi:O-antigen/teichoic acid export membrane protein
MPRKISFLNFDRNMHEVIQKGAFALGLKLLSAVLILAFNILLARMVGPEGAGIYFLTLTVATIATLFGRVGLDDTLVRFTAANVELQNWPAVKGVYQKGMMLALVASSISALVVLISAPWLAQGVFSKPELTEPLRWISLSIVPVTLMILHAQMLQGLRRIFEYLLIQWQGIGISILSIVILFTLGKNWGAMSAVWAFLIATIVMAFVGFWRWRAATPQLQNIIGDFDMSDLLQSSMPLFWVTTMNYVMNAGSTPILLGVWWSSEDVGIYGAATRTAQLTSLILIAINATAAPKFAALYTKGEIKVLGKVARQSTMLGTLVAAPILLMFIIIPEYIMGAFGPDFTRGSTVLVIMALGQFVNVAAGSVGYLLKMSGHEQYLKKASIRSAILNMALNVSLIPFFGIIGAAIADSLTLIYKNIYAAFLVKKHVNINLLIFAKK